MSLTLRFVTKQSVQAAIQSAVSPAPTRKFHSPFVVLDSSKLSTHYHPQTTKFHYEKQLDHTPEPQRAVGGARISFVSEPDPSHTPYAVPIGAYPVSAPYVDFSPPKFPGFA